MRASIWHFAAFSALIPLGVSPAAATEISDGAGDFLASYTGPSSSDLDIIGASVTFDGLNFDFDVTAGGQIGTTPNSLFVWAINRGSGISRPVLAPPDGASLLWDAVVVMFPDGTLRVVTFPTAGPPSITNLVGGTTVLGNELSGTVLASLLPSTGLPASDYTFSLWSRVRVNPTADGLNSEVADLLTGSGAIRAAAVPEPSTWLMMLLGFGCIGGAMRRTNRRAPLNCTAEHSTSYCPLSTQSGH